MVGSKEAGVSRVMSLGISSRRIAQRELGRNLGDRELRVAFEASADDRDTRGFISIATIRPSVGLIAN